MAAIYHGDARCVNIEKYLKNVLFIICSYKCYVAAKGPSHFPFVALHTIEYCMGYVHLNEKINAT